jgi:hypothetical protein
MTNVRFWELVELAEWGKDHDYKRIERLYLRTMTLIESEEFREIFNAKRSALDDFIGDRNPAGGGDDSHGDLMAHIIGLGQAEYVMSLSDYAVILKRGQARDFEESFSYGIPYKESYVKLNNLDYLIVSGTKLKEEVKAFRLMDTKGDLKPILRSFALIDIAADFLLAKDLVMFRSMEMEFMVQVDIIIDFFDKNSMELPRKFTDNSNSSFHYSSFKNILRNCYSHISQYIDEVALDNQSVG